MNRRQADRGFADIGAASLALVAFVVLPYAFEGSSTSLGLLAKGYWTLLVVMCGIVLAATAAIFAPGQTALRLGASIVSLGTLFVVGPLDGAVSIAWGVGAAALAASAILLAAQRRAQGPSRQIVGSLP